jgi:cytochrome c2
MKHLLIAFSLATPALIAAATGPAPPWQAMDYGPFLTASIEAPHPATNIAFKGIAINLGANSGGDHNEAVIFDTDLLRYSAGWTGGFVALTGIVFDGEHWAYPRIEGPQLFGNPIAPGWANAGSFHDPREFPYGPLPRNWAHWKGLYLHEQKVVLSYTVGAMSVLEMPALERRGNTAAFVRLLNLSPSTHDQIVQLAYDPERQIQVLHRDNLRSSPHDLPAARSIAVFAEVDPPKLPASDSSTHPDVLAAAFVGDLEDAQWLITRDGHLRLALPAGTQPIHCKILLWSGPRSALPDFAALVESSPPPPDLEPLTRGGPARWPRKLITQGVPGTNDGPYAIDTLTEPDPNPWRSWMRFGGLDFFPDGKRAALCTWNGDVWLVSGVDEDLRDLTWQRIATGLFQPLGLRIVDHQIHVLGRDQITRLHDLNGDGESDFYENFNNDCMVSEHFHEFALDLKTGPDGSFYYIKCACHGTTAKHPHHGTLMKVSRDGSSSEVIAGGFRANNGLGVGPRGELTSIENQGHWMPANRVNWIKPGGWYGYQWAWNPENRVTYDEPLCWMHNSVDRSGGTQLWVPTDSWGPFRDEIITVSYGMGHVFLLLKEEISGVMQGAVTRFPLEFETGVMRGAWHPHNGQLYVAGLYGWAGNKTRAGGFYRIRYTGQPVYMVRTLHFLHDGVVLGFTNPLDPTSATDPGNYSVTAWNYRWTADYGSPDFKLNGQEGRDTWPVESATVSADRTTVFLKLPDVQPVMQMHVAFNLVFADGARIENFVHGTIHQLNAKSGADLLGSGTVVRAEETRINLARPTAGLIQSFTNTTHPEQQDSRLARLPALFVPAEVAPTPYLDPGPFRCRWEGFLNLELNDEVTFEMAGHGTAALRINEQVALDVPDVALPGAHSDPIPLRGGLNRFELEYQSPAQGDAQFHLSWSSKRLPLEPIPATAFVHDAVDPVLSQRQRARHGRHLFATLQCTRCHQPHSPWPSTAMPELNADAPSLNGIGSRLNTPWIAQWLLDPKAIRPDTTMPRTLSGPRAALEATDIAAFLADLREPAPPLATDSGIPTSNADSLTDGSQLFASLGCVACHLLPGELKLANDARVPLHHSSAKWRPQALQSYLKAPSRHFRWTHMPDFKLSTNETSALAAFVLSRADTDPDWQEFRRHRPGDYPGDPTRGRELVVSLGCLACHTLDDVEYQSVAPTFERLIAADWTRGCLAEQPGSRGTAPDFALNPEQRTALQAFSKDGFPETLRRDVTAEFADRAYVSLRCNACHSRDNETDLLTALNAAVAKLQLHNDEESGVGGTVHLGRPALTHSGEKLYSTWMQRLLEGSLPYKTRPELQGRMPAFAPFASGMAEGFAHQHGYAGESAPIHYVDPELAEVGRRLTLVDGGFSCVTCHNVGPQRALAGRDTATVDFQCVAERLRPSYYWRYIRDPVRLVPSTMMPRFINDDGTTPIKSVFDGDPQMQFDAVWHYLMSLRSAIPSQPSQTPVKP